MQGNRADHAALVSAGIAGVVASVVLGFFFARGDAPPDGFDGWWMTSVIGLRSDVVDAAAMVLNHVGGGWLAILVVPIGGAVAFLFARRPWSALVFILGSALSAGACQLMKAAFGRGRPEDILLPLENGSFPSGHATNAAVIAVMLGLLLRRVWVWVLGALYVVAMAFSRTLLGAHWVSDTVAGALLGAGVAAIVVWALLPQLQREPLPAPDQPSGSSVRSRT